MSRPHGAFFRSLLGLAGELRRRYDYKKAAKAQHLSVGAWVRQVLRSARGRSSSDPAEKLAAIRSAARHSFPTADIDEVLAQIERGYTREEG